MRKQAKLLDDFVKKFNACCRFAANHWSGKELMAELDRLSNSRLFSELHQRHAKSLGTPDHANLFVDIGAETNNANGKANNAVTISYAIMQTRQ